MSKKIVIGVIGKAGSGKDTFGDYVVKKYSFDKLAFADPLKAGVKAIFMLDDHTAYDRVAREQPLEDFPEWSFRKLLQYVGTELFRGHIDDAIWIKLLFKRIRNHSNSRFVVSDVRFPNELEVLKSNKDFDFYSFKVVRDGYVGTDVGIKSHASESHDLQADFTIQNDGTIEDLYGKIDVVMTEIIRKNSEKA